MIPQLQMEDDPFETPRTAGFPLRWRCKDGRVLYVWEMDDQHVAHSIAKIKREGDWRIAWLPILEKELAWRIMKAMNSVWRAT